MGIGGGILYSFVFMTLDQLSRSGSIAMRVLRWIGRALFDGAVLYGMSLGGSQLFHDPQWRNLQEWRDNRIKD
jgi:tetrahydromethanopterin S-methyltransferase subunit D